MRNIFKTMEEVSKEACNIIGNPTLKETKHKNICRQAEEYEKKASKTF